MNSSLLRAKERITANDASSSLLKSWKSWAWANRITSWSGLPLTLPRESFDTRANGGLSPKLIAWSLRQAFKSKQLGPAQLCEYQLSTMNYQLIFRCDVFSEKSVDSS